MVETMPLFPLGTVLMPGAPLPLHVFEPRYRQMTNDLVTGAIPGKRFGVVAVRDGWGPDDGVDALHPVGCTAALREVRRLPDGRFEVLTRGERRFRLLDVNDSTAPYLVANVEWVPDRESEPGDDTEALVLAARAAHRQYCRTVRHQRHGDDDGSDPHPGSRPAGLLDDGDADAESAPDDTEPALLAHLLAGDCLLPIEDRQQLLEQTCPVRRLQMVRRYLVREAGLLRELRAVWAPTARFAVAAGDN